MYRFDVDNTCRTTSSSYSSFTTSGGGLHPRGGLPGIVDGPSLVHPGGGGLVSQYPSLSTAASGGGGCAVDLHQLQQQPQQLSARRGSFLYRSGSEDCSGGDLPGVGSGLAVGLGFGPTSSSSALTSSTIVSCGALGGGPGAGNGNQAYEK
jgi:hypothetical protein